MILWPYILAGDKISKYLIFIEKYNNYSLNVIEDGSFEAIVAYEQKKLSPEVFPFIAEAGGRIVEGNAQNFILFCKQLLFV